MTAAVGLHGLSGTFHPACQAQEAFTPVTVKGPLCNGCAKFASHHYEGMPRKCQMDEEENLHAEFPLQEPFIFSSFHECIRDWSGRGRGASGRADDSWERLSQEGDIHTNILVIKVAFIGWEPGH